MTPTPRLPHAFLVSEALYAVVVVDDSGSLRGIVSSLDVVRWVAARDRFVPRRSEQRLRFP